MFYKLKNCTVNIHLVKFIEKVDVIPRLRSGDDDDLTSIKGNFKIVIDEKEFSYETIQERDCVYNDIVNKLNSPSDTGIVYTDKQALAVLF